MANDRNTETISAKGIWEVLQKSGEGFVRNKVTKLSASLAYYTIFSFGPMLIVIIFLSNLIWEQNAIEDNIVAQLKDFIGISAASQVQEIIKMLQ
ncbi:MAG: YhjD/YihY/BrkB family envelope integrity protein [Ginsengibacter sp.]